MPTPRFLNDHPANKDTDTLRFRRVVATIEEQVRNYMDDFMKIAEDGGVPADDFGALTLGIEGAWGQGKTSLLRQIATHFQRSDKQPSCVWVNPWKHRDRESIWSTLLAEVIKAFPENVLKEAARHWSDVMGTAVDSIFQFIGAGRPIKELRSLLPKQATGKERFVESFRHAAITNAKRKGQEEEILPVMVFLDDLDRCEPDVTMEVLEAIKQYLDIPGCVFFAAYDPHKVEPLVGRRFAGGMPDEGVGEKAHRIIGRHYLQKIFTTTIALPRSEPRLFEEYVRTCLDTAQIANDDGGLRSRLIRIAVPDNEHNPRRVKKIINRFVFRWHFMLPEGPDGTTESSRPKGEVLMLLAVLEECWPAVFHYVAQTPEGSRERLAEVLAGNPDKPADLLQPDEQNTLKDYIEKIRDWIGEIPELGPYLVMSLSLAEAMKDVGDEERHDFLMESLLRGDVAAINRLRIELPDYRPRIKPGTRLDERIKLDGIDLSRAMLKACDLEGVSLVAANLRGADLTGSGLARAWLDRADLSSAKLRDVDFTGASLEQTDLRDADYNEPQLANTHGTPRRA